MPETPIDPRDLEIGQYVAFSCYHPTDQLTYEGKITGIVDYSTARQLEADLIPYHREVNKLVADLAPYSTLTYLILEYTQGLDEEMKTLRVVRAREWIDPATIIVYTPDTYFDVRIYNLTRKLEGNTVIELLRSHGYVTTLVNS